MTLEEKQIADQQIFLRKSVNANLTSTLKCSVCLLQFSNEHSLDLHKKAHLNTGDRIIFPKLRCKICKVKFTDKTSFENHLLSEEHVNSQLFQPIVAIEKDRKIEKLLRNLYSKSSKKCNLCFKVFHNKELFEKHKSFHKTGSLCECPNCFEPLNNMRMLNKHKAYHSNKDKRFECFACGKECTKYSTLIAHFEHSVCNWKTKKIRKKQLNIKRPRTKHAVCQICFEESLDILSHVKIHTTRFKR